MIEVGFWWGNPDGNGYSRYLIDVPTDNDHSFKTAPTVIALRRALIEFERESLNRQITKIDIRTTSDKVLQP